MALLRYSASADNVITNAFRSNLESTSRATGSNMGYADSVEVFSIYGQVSNSSGQTQELARTLIKFPVASIAADRTAGTIPASGSVNFYLRMFNAEHPFTLPEDFTLVVAPITTDWTEGSGLDMDEYKDRGKSNWMRATSTKSWTAQGGDYRSTENKSVKFPLGYEDLETDITETVENWIEYEANPSNGFANYGVGVRLQASEEAYAVAAVSSSGIIANASGAKTTYYTKKFFARGTEFFFKRPVIEARWDSRTTDDRGNMYFSSSVVPQAENLYTLYYYNYVRGRLRNLPGTTNASGIANGKLKVCFYSGSSTPKGDRLKIWNGGTCVTASLVSGKTGIYNCQVALTAAATPVTKVFDVWFTASADSEVATATYATQSFNIAKIPNYQSVPTFEYDNTVTNLRSSYSKNETARFRVFSRNKSWNPNLYVKATSNIPTVVNQSASFAVFRTTDNLPVISYGTGSDMHTYMSYDLSGNYCDVNMNLLEPDYMYNIKFAFYNDSIGSWVEQPQTFKFRVEE